MIKTVFKGKILLNSINFEEWPFIYQICLLNFVAYIEGIDLQCGFSFIFGAPILMSIKALLRKKRNEETDWG